MDIPAGQTGGPPLPEGQRSRRSPTTGRGRAAPTGSIGGYVPGQRDARLPRGHGDAPAEGRVAGVPDALHDHRQGDHRSHDAWAWSSPRSRRRCRWAAPRSSTARCTFPAGAANHRVDAEMTLNRDLLLFSMTPHTHVRGKRWYYEAIYPDGRRETMLSVPNYDFEWQHEYQFASRSSCRRARRSTPRRGTTTRRRTSRIPMPPRTCGGAIRPGKR